MRPSNVLKIKSLHSDWCDKDQVMLHACFQLLEDCIKEENLLDGHTDWGHDEKHRAAKSELVELYEWWLERVKKDDIDPLSEQQYEEDNQMLIRLIKVRWALWT